MSRDDVDPVEHQTVATASMMQNPGGRLDPSEGRLMSGYNDVRKHVHAKSSSESLAVREVPSCSAVISDINAFKEDVKVCIQRFGI